MIRTGAVFRILSSIRVRWILALFILAAAASKAGETGIQAKRAADFVNSMGINVHMKYTNTPYGDTERIYEALQALGMRHFRDEINNTAPWFVARLKHIGSMGYALCGLIEGGNDYPSPGSKLEAGAVIPMIANLRPFIEAVEGPNEPDDPTKPPFEYGVNFDPYPQGAIEESEDLWSIVKSTSEIRDLPVLGMSEGTPQDFAKLAAIPPNPFPDATYGDLHAYQGGGLGDAGLPGYIYYAREFTGSRALWTTEMGYHNNINYLSDGEQQGVSTRASAIYLPIAFLSEFNKGVLRTFSYELIDEFDDPNPTSQSGGEGHYGLLNYDFTPKPAYTALKNFIALLRDSGRQTFQPGSIEIEFDGAPSTMRYTLLQESTGEFFLAIWDNVPVYQVATEQTSGQDIYPADVPVTLQFSTPASFTVFSPSDESGVNPTEDYTASITPTSISINLPPEMLLIRIVGR
jgi:hypothetical protein